MRLYFLRHGIAEDREKWQGDDTDRPLTEKGRKRLERTAKNIAPLDLELDAIITSPLLRARETAEIMAKILKLKDALREDARLAPGFNLAALKNLLAEHAECKAILLVGHEPDFSQTIHALTHGVVVMKKGALARVDLDDVNTLEGHLAWLIPPKVLSN
ncbi:MAG: phosphohistidine phosphatase SixA [Anaerolineales bacterium]